MSNERQLKDILKNIAEKSSVPGINQIFSSKQVAIKLLWSIMLLATTGVASFQLYELLMDYYSYPIKTRVSLEFSALPYPALSFCNMNPIKKSMVVNASDAVRNIIYPGENGKIRKTISLKRRKKREVDPSVLLNSDFTALKTDVLSPFESTSYISTTTVKYMETSHITKGYESKYDSDYDSCTSDYSESEGGSGNTAFYWDWPTFDYYTWSDSSLWAEWPWSESTSYEESFNNPHVSWEEYYYDQVMAPKDKWIQRIEHFKTAFKNESQELRESMGHRLEDFIQSASFSANKLDNSVFKQFNTVDYGNCYTLSSRKFIAWRSGPNYGIQLTLNLEQDEYIENFATGYGVRLVIHEPDAYPFPSEEGITLNPGHETSIGLKLVSVSRLSEPYGKCTDGRDFQRKFQYRYTIQACMQICRLMMTVDQCACAPPESPEVNFDGRNYRVCSENVADKTCMLRVSLEFNQGDPQCDCSPLCKYHHHHGFGGTSQYRSYRSHKESAGQRNLRRIVTKTYTSRRPPITRTQMNQVNAIPPLCKHLGRRNIDTLEGATAHQDPQERQTHQLFQLQRNHILS